MGSRKNRHGYLFSAIGTQRSKKSSGEILGASNAYTLLKRLQAARSGHSPSTHDWAYAEMSRRRSGWPMHSRISRRGAAGDCWLRRAN